MTIWTKVAVLLSLGMFQVPKIWAKEIPAPLSQEDFKSYFRDLRDEMQSAQGERRKALIGRLLEEAVIERAAKYEGATIRVTSEPKMATMGTSLNFREERKLVRFSIKSPRPPGLLRVSKFPASPLIVFKRGSKSRVTDKSVLHASKQSEEVVFRFTLVEPNLNEKDVHVMYSGWVEFEFTSAGARAAAKDDLVPVFEFASRELTSREEIDRAEAERDAAKAAADASRRANADAERLDNVPVADPPADSDWEKVGNISVVFVAGITCPLIVQSINSILRRRRRRRNGFTNPPSSCGEVPKGSLKDETGPRNIGDGERSD